VGGREARKLSVCLDGLEGTAKAGFVERLRKLLQESLGRGRARRLRLAGQHWNFSPIPHSPWGSGLTSLVNLIEGSR
jgi:hypothetical protein